MDINEVMPTIRTEDWVCAALSKASKVGGGTFAVVLDAEQDGWVVKLTCSEADYTALIHFSGSSTHFPQVIKQARDQCHGRNGPFHALLMEKMSDCGPPEAGDIANFINRQPPHKHNPLGLLVTAQRMREGLLTGYPESLAEAVACLGEYAIAQRLKVELNQRWNWGLRTDGTLVMLDLVHSLEEM